MSICASDWMKLNCGDYLRERDGRHIARVEAVIHSRDVKLRWLDTGHITWINLADYLDRGEWVKLTRREREEYRL